MSYWRWYSNNTGNAPNTDVFVIDISDDEARAFYEDPGYATLAFARRDLGAALRDHDRTGTFPRGDWDWRMRNVMCPHYRPLDTCVSPSYPAGDRWAVSRAWAVPETLEAAVFYQSFSGENRRMELDLIGEFDIFLGVCPFLGTKRGQLLRIFVSIRLGVHF